MASDIRHKILFSPFAYRHAYSVKHLTDSHYSYDWRIVVGIVLDEIPLSSFDMGLVSCQLRGVFTRSLAIRLVRPILPLRLVVLQTL